MAISKLSTNASLKQVMDKFEEISLQDLSVIDVVVKSELPSTVKEGQIVVITDKDPSNILFSFNEPSSMNENDLYIRMYTKDQELFRVKSSKKTIEFYVFGVKQFVNGAFVGVKSYIGVNSEWKSMNEKYYVKDDITLNSSDFTSSIDVANYYFRVENNVIKIASSVSGTSQYNHWIYTNYLIDITSYSKIGIKLKALQADQHPGYQQRIKFGVISKDLNTEAQGLVNFSDICSSPNMELVSEIDISALKGEHRLMVGTMLSTGRIVAEVTELYLK